MSRFARQYEYNTSRGRYYTALSSLPDTIPDIYPVRYIAYFLPQYHKIPENNEWWGAGFTEWTNVTKAIPRYLGHYQPRLPGDLGFYELSNADHIRRQVEIAKRGGIYGFCIHSYWFSGHRLLETPLRLILNNKDIEIPFCLNWANESWSRRWDGSESEVLIRQNYDPGEDIEYAEYISEFLEDPRYIKVNGRPLIMLYRPSHLPDARATVDRWREYFVKRRLGDPFIVMPQARGDDDPRIYGMDAAAGFPPHKVGFSGTDIRWELKLLDKTFSGSVVSYDQTVARSIENIPNGFRLFPGVCPQWDNEARSPNRGFSLAGSTPQKYANWLGAMSKYAMQAPTKDERVVFINAWNEWAEGAYLEPDRHFGCAYLAQTRMVLEGLSSPDIALATSIRTPTGLSRFEAPQPSLVNLIENLPRMVLRKIARKFQKRGRGE